jgi:hypothetical protein
MLPPKRPARTAAVALPFRPALYPPLAAAASRDVFGLHARTNAGRGASIPSSWRFAFPTNRASAARQPARHAASRSVLRQLKQQPGNRPSSEHRPSSMTSFTATRGPPPRGSSLVMNVATPPTLTVLPRGEERWRRACYHADAFRAPDHRAASPSARRRLLLGPDISQESRVKLPTGSDQTGGARERRSAAADAVVTAEAQRQRRHARVAIPGGAPMKHRDRSEAGV